MKDRGLNEGESFGDQLCRAARVVECKLHMMPTGAQAAAKRAKRHDVPEISAQLPDQQDAAQRVPPRALRYSIRAEGRITLGF